MRLTTVWSIWLPKGLGCGEEGVQVVDGVGHMMQTITSLNTKDELGKATTNLIQGNRFKWELGGQSVS
jgi:hypothetical protein